MSKITYAVAYITCACGRTDHASDEFVEFGLSRLESPKEDSRLIKLHFESRGWTDKCPDCRRKYGD